MVTTCVIVQPEVVVYVIIDVPPVADPVIVPELDPTDAIDGLLLDHVPPVGIPVNVVGMVPQNDAEPEIDGVWFTVTVPPALPQLFEKPIIVVPAVNPFTNPVTEPIVATAVLLLVQVPAPARSVKVSAKPVHNRLLTPDIEAGIAVTVTVAVDVPAHAP